MYTKGRRFLNFEFVHPDSAGESNAKPYLEKAIFDILSNSKLKRNFSFQKSKKPLNKVGIFFSATRSWLALKNSLFFADLKNMNLP